MLSSNIQTFKHKNFHKNENYLPFTSTSLLSNGTLGYIAIPICLQLTKAALHFLSTVSSYFSEKKCQVGPLQM